MAGVRDDPGRLRCLEDPERRRQATETVSQQPQPVIQSGPQCHPAIMPARISNEINSLQGPKTRGRKGQLWKEDRAAKNGERMSLSSAFLGGNSE
jgi:hypothetical protein